MVLKTFKVKSNIKYLNKLLANRQVKVSENKVKNVGVILNKAEFDNINKFSALAQLIKTHANKLKIAIFTLEDIKSDNDAIVYFSPKDFGWNGTIKTEALKTFLNFEFDLLINYYSSDSLDLKITTARSKAYFKIGVLQTDTRLNDLIINTEIKDFDVFKNEVFKYLTILNKI